MGTFPPTWLEEAEGKLLQTLWLLIVICSLGEEEGSGKRSWDTRSKEVIVLGTILGSYEPRDCRDKGKIVLTMATVGEGLRVDKGKDPMREESLIQFQILIHAPKCSPSLNLIES